MHDEFDIALRTAREAFLSGGPVPEGVIREDILKSWRRSALVGAARDRPTLPHWNDFDHGRLSRLAVPVLDNFSRHLDSTATTLVLADARSRIVRRWIGEKSLGTALDRCQAVPGVSLAEEYCGTNGIGSAIEERRAVKVAGNEHWADRFLGFTCVGAPVLHPLSRQPQGVVTLACRHTDANQLMLPLVLTITAAIEARLRQDSGRREQRLLDRFLAISRGSRRGVIVLNERVIMTNAAAARVLNCSDHAMLWQQSAEAIDGRRSGSKELVLGSGRVVASTVSPLDDDGEVVGAVIELTTTSSSPPAPVRTRSLASAAPTEASPLDQLIGRSRAWRDVVEHASRHRLSTLPVLITGEAGVGKMALGSAMFGGPTAGRLIVLDAALEPVDGLTAWLQPLRNHAGPRPGAVIIAHVDLLGPVAAHALCAVLDELELRGGVQIGATATGDRSRATTATAGLIQRFSTVQIEIPPLRDRREDIAELAEVFLARDGAPGHRWAPEALQALVRADWPGNVRQLHNVVRGVLGNGAIGEVGVPHLPSELRSAPHQHLSRMERMELDAIVVALDHCRGNKSDAAALLGISRSTMYRKIRAFGLDLERTTL